MAQLSTIQVSHFRYNWYTRTTTLNDCQFGKEFEMSQSTTHNLLSASGLENLTVVKSVHSSYIVSDSTYNSWKVSFWPPCESSEGEIFSTRVRVPYYKESFIAECWSNSSVNQNKREKHGQCCQLKRCIVCVVASSKNCAAQYRFISNLVCTSTFYRRCAELFCLDLLFFTNRDPILTSNLRRLLVFATVLWYIWKVFTNGFILIISLFYFQLSESHSEDKHGAITIWTVCFILWEHKMRNKST